MNVNESERERSGIIRGQFYGVWRGGAIFRGALKIFEPQVLKACVKEYQNPNNVPLGELRKIERKDGFGNTKIEFVGRESFVKAMGRPGRRVVSFRTDQGYVDASGRGLR